MSTPTSTSLPQPTSASKKSAHSAAAVTTPSTLGVSPAPRSVPSPAATRHAAKTPTNMVNKPTAGGTPMVATLSQSGMNFSSPAGGTTGASGIGTGFSMGSFGGTPNMGGLMGGMGLGLEMGGTPGVGAMQTPNGGVGMIPTMSELGLTVSGAKRNEDEERRERMRRVLRSIGRAKGRVSEEGIVRIARRIGLDNDIDKVVLEPEERAKLVGNRTIALGGKTTLIEVKLKEHRAVGVDVVFGMGEKEWETKGAQKAGEVLLRDLKGVEEEDGGGEVLVKSRLDKFAENLVRLARIDQISDDGVNCFEAIDGVFVCLRRLFEREKHAVGGEDARKAEREVLCKRSGRPSLHENGRIGMSLDYWTSAPLPPPASTKDDSHMDLDGQDPQHDHPEPNLWSLRIDAEVCSAALYPSLRISEDWLPSDLTLPSPTDPNESLPWQDPPPTYISTAENDPDAQTGDAMALDNNTESPPKLPDLRFIAKLDPPLVVPYQTATNILASLGLAPPQTLLFQHFHALLLDLPINAGTVGFTEVVEGEQSVLIPTGEVEPPGGGGEIERQHQYILDIAKPEWGLMLEELPFSHPRQLVDLLPTLRQWARVRDLMGGCFGSPTLSSPTSLNGVATSDMAMGANDSIVGLITPGRKVGLDNLLSTPAKRSDSPPPFDSSAPSPPKPKDEDPISISVELATSPHPSISLAFPLKDEWKVGSVEVQVGINGILGIGGCENLGMGKEGDGEGEGDVEAQEKLQAEKDKLAKALEACGGDLGVWVEWLRGRVG